MQAKNEMEAIKALNEKVAGIVESGSNENGSWVKFADGTMIQWGQENNGEKGFATVNYPINFANTNICLTANGGYKKYGQGGSTKFDMFITSDAVDTSLAYLYTRRLVNGVVTNVVDTEQKIFWQAVGRWK